MSYVALFATDDASACTTRRVLAPDELHCLQDARELLAALQAQREQAQARQLAEIDRARQKAHAAGYAEGQHSARNELAKAQLALAEAAQREREALRRQTQSTVTMLALEVVRKLAHRIDPADLVSELAASAVRELIDDEPVTLVVYPAVARRVRERCMQGQQRTGRWPVVEVQEDPALQTFDCKLVTRAGTTLAGLDAQLRRLEAVWGATEVAA